MRSFEQYTLEMLNNARFGLNKGRAFINVSNEDGGYIYIYIYSVYPPLPCLIPKGYELSSFSFLPRGVFTSSKHGLRFLGTHAMHHLTKEHDLSPVDLPTVRFLACPGSRQIFGTHPNPINSKRTPARLTFFLLVLNSRESGEWSTKKVKNNHLGKLSYFTNLNCWAFGDDLP